MRIAFDPAKRAATLESRGLDMLDAAEVFDGPTRTVPDDRKDYGETRFITFGFLRRRLVVVIWVRREDARRIISLRKANAREQAAIGASLRP